MLALTEQAGTAIRGIVEASELPDESGLRITAEHVGEDQAALALAFVPEPDPEDRVVDEHGAHVFLEPVAADLLDDKVLDAVVQEDRISFAITDREDEPVVGGRNGAAPEPE